MWDEIRRRFQWLKYQEHDLVEVQQVVEELLEESTLNLSYLVLIIGSCTIATLGLLANSTAVIIGAMIVAPLMLPIRAFAFGALVGNLDLFRRGIVSLGVGSLIAVGFAWGLGVMVGLSSYGSEVLSRSKPTLLDLGIAIAAGGISGYAKVQPKISGSLAGTAIAVALMPPLCVIGLGFAQNDWPLSLGATLLYATNLLGIALACMIAFLLTGYTPIRRARKAIGWALALTATLLLPLSISFAELVRQSRLENSLRQALINRTITFQRLELISINTNWLANPPHVQLNVRAQEPVTPRQVELLEAFVAREMGQPFQLTFLVSQVEEVNPDGRKKSNLHS